MPSPSFLSRQSACQTLVPTNARTYANSLSSEYVASDGFASRSTSPPQVSPRSIIQRYILVLFFSLSLPSSLFCSIHNDISHSVRSIAAHFTFFPSLKNFIFTPSRLVACGPNSHSFPRGPLYFCVLHLFLSQLTICRPISACLFFPSAQRIFS